MRFDKERENFHFSDSNSTQVTMAGAEVSTSANKGSILKSAPGLHCVHCTLTATDSILKRAYTYIIKQNGINIHAILNV